MTRRLAVIGVPCGAGAHHAGLERGPAALHAAGLLDRLRQAGCEVSHAGDLTARVFTADAAHPRARNRDAVVQACRDVAAAVGPVIAAGRIPALLGRGLQHHGRGRGGLPGAAPGDRSAVPGRRR